MRFVVVVGRECVKTVMIANILFNNCMVLLHRAWCMPPDRRHVHAWVAKDGSGCQADEHAFAGRGAGPGSFGLSLTRVGPVRQVRLIDFNPIGGTTSPLLFDWDELPYAHIAPDAASAHAGGSASGHDRCDEGPLSRRQLQSEREAAGGASPAAHCPATEHAGRAMDSAGLQPDLGVCRAAGMTRTPEAAPEGGESVQRQREDASRDGGVLGGEVEFRVVMEPADLRPNPAACRAPFDFADTGAGGAQADLLRKLQLESQ